jgi:hypothetical protein
MVFVKEARDIATTHSGYKLVEIHTAFASMHPLKIALAPFLGALASAIVVPRYDMCPIVNTQCSGEPSGSIANGCCGADLVECSEGVWTLEKCSYNRQCVFIGRVRCQ